MTVMEANDVEKSPLRALFWRDEILQVMYWMKGEGLGNTVSASQILPLLNTNADNLNYHLHKMQKEGYLKNENGTYSLSDIGSKEGGRRFSDAFQGLQKAGHGECGPDCEFCYGPNGQKLENCVHNCAH